MLSGMTDFVENEEEESKKELVPPGELQVLWMTKNYHALPWKGGLFDQPSFLMICMNVCESSEKRAEEIKRRILETKRRAETHEN
jgi:hypothetical protein